MTNHFHILVEVPKRPEPEDLPDDAGLVAKVRSSLGDKAANGLAWELKHLRSLDGAASLAGEAEEAGETGEAMEGEKKGASDPEIVETGGAEAAERLRELWFARMWDFSPFMKSLKQVFSQWYNKRNDRTGTLWESRFHSVLVQGAGLALRTI